MTHSPAYHTLFRLKFLCAVRDRKPPETDGWAGLAAQAVPEAFFESSYLGEAVRVDDVMSGEVEGYQAEINERRGLSTAC